MTDHPVQLMARAPVPGRVKTRLAEVLGDRGACAVYERILGHLLHRLAPVLSGATVWVDGPLDHPAFDGLRHHGTALRPQPAGDLGVRMDRILEHAFEGGVPGVLVGSDLPTLGPEHVRAARSALRGGREAVFAPAEDGGYGLVALARPLPELFKGMPWSTERVLEESLARLARAGMDRARVSLLDPLWDVDEPPDLERLFALPGYADLRELWRGPAPARSRAGDQAV